MLADGLNKALSGPTLKHHSIIYTGRRFLPPRDSLHYKDTNLAYYCLAYTRKVIIFLLHKLISCIHKFICFHF